MARPGSVRGFVLGLAIVAVVLTGTALGQRGKSPRKAKKKSPPSPVEAIGSLPPLPVVSKPNFVVLLVDDQDYLLNSTHRAYMPKLHQYIGDRGIHLNNFVVSTSLCCPSRVSLLTGMYTHNHNVTSNQTPTGGYRKFREYGYDSQWLPTWLRPLGYRTYFTGKFVNLWDVPAGDVANCPRGWDMFDPLTDKTVYNYRDFDFTPNCARAESFTNSYQTDVIQERALRYIDDAVEQGSPFYLQINPAACHTACPKGGDEGGKCTNPIPADKYRGTFRNVRVPQLSNWGVQLDTVLGIGAESINELGISKHYQARLETMLSVDDLVEAVVQKLEAVGQLDNTYIVYVSDNGYHLGNHMIAKGKTLPYEEDVRVPFYMRGPGIPAGLVSSYQATTVDLTASIVQLAGGSTPEFVDGIPIPLDRIATTQLGTRNPYPIFPNTQGELRQMLPIEMWINSLAKNLNRKDYRSVRVCSHLTLTDTGSVTTSAADTCWKYTVWCVYPFSLNHHELFDLGRDPGEVNNLYDRFNGSQPDGQRFINRLDALLQVMGMCKGATCQTPWRKLHPDGSVNTLEEAMATRFDAKYAAYSKFRWRACSQFYNPWRNEQWDASLSDIPAVPPVQPRAIGGTGARRQRTRRGL